MEIFSQKVISVGLCDVTTGSEKSQTMRYNGRRLVLGSFYGNGYTIKLSV